MGLFTIEAHLTTDLDRDESRSLSVSWRKIVAVSSALCRPKTVLPELPRGGRGHLAEEVRAVCLASQGRKAVWRAREPEAAGPNGSSTLGPLFREHRVQIPALPTRVLRT